MVDYYTMLETIQTALETPGDWVGSVVTWSHCIFCFFRASPFCREASRPGCCLGTNCDFSVWSNWKSPTSYLLEARGESGMTIVYCFSFFSFLRKYGYLRRKGSWSHKQLYSPEMRKSDTSEMFRIKREGKVVPFLIFKAICLPYFSTWAVCISHCFAL